MKVKASTQKGTWFCSGCIGNISEGDLVFCVEDETDGGFCICINCARDLVEMLQSVLPANKGG